MPCRPLAFLMLVTLAAGCVPVPATPASEPSAEPLRREVPSPTRTVTVPSRAPGATERVESVSPHLFKDNGQLYLTFFFNTRSGQQIFFKGGQYQLNYKLAQPDGTTSKPLVDQDLVMTADEQRFVVPVPEGTVIKDQLRCKFAAGLPDGRRLTGETLLTIAPDRNEPAAPEATAAAAAE